MTLGTGGTRAETDEFGEFSLSTMDHRDVCSLRVAAEGREIVCAIPELAR